MAGPEIHRKIFSFDIMIIPGSKVVVKTASLGVKVRNSGKPAISHQQVTYTVVSLGIALPANMNRYRILNWEKDIGDPKAI